MQRRSIPRAIGAGAWRWPACPASRKFRRGPSLWLSRLQRGQHRSGGADHRGAPGETARPDRGRAEPRRGGRRDRGVRSCGIGPTPDGATLVSTPNAIVVLPRMVQTTYDLASFASVGLISFTSLVIVVRSDNPKFKSLPDLIYARANPGVVANSGKMARPITWRSCSYRMRRRPVRQRGGLQRIGACHHRLQQVRST